MERKEKEEKRISGARTKTGAPAFLLCCYCGPTLGLLHIYSIDQSSFLTFVPI